MTNSLNQFSQFPIKHWWNISCYNKRIITILSIWFKNFLDILIIESTNVQQYYVFQHMFNSDAHSSWHCDWYMFQWFCNMCKRIFCTQQEYNALFLIYINISETSVANQTVDLLETMNKIGTISAHVDLYHFPDYYWRYRDILSKYNGDYYTIRFYECLEKYYWALYFIITKWFSNSSCSCLFLKLWIQIINKSMLVFLFCWVDSWGSMVSKGV